MEGRRANLQTVNSMVRQLTVFANEVSRVALEVGTLGILGGQAEVGGVEGVWDDLTTNVNVSCLYSSFICLRPRFVLPWLIARKWLET